MLVSYLFFDGRVIFGVDTGWYLHDGKRLSLWDGSGVGRHDAEFAL